MINIISCAGYGNSGSSVVTDFFSEFSCIKVLQGSSFEFGLIHEADGIRDLENAVVEGNRLKTDLAIKRFIKLINELNSNNTSGPNYKNFFNGRFIDYTLDYLDSLNVIIWENGWWHRIYEVTNELNFKKKLQQLLYEKKFNRLQKNMKYALFETDSWRPSYSGFTRQYYCHVSKKEFKDKTKSYLNRLFSEIADDGDFLLVDQLFPSNVDSEYLEYFDNAKVIVVDRDPRDLYFMNKVYWGSGYIPSEKVETFINWYKFTRNNTSEDSHILKIKFEDMIFNNELTEKKLCDFINIDIKNHDKPNTRLDITKSISNTQVFNKIKISVDSISETIDSDLEKIKVQLKDYLFDFPLYTGEKKQQDQIIENLYKKTQEKKFLDIFLILFIVINKGVKKIFRKIKSIAVKK